MTILAAGCILQTFLYEQFLPRKCYLGGTFVSPIHQLIDLASEGFESKHDRTPVLDLCLVETH